MKPFISQFILILVFLALLFFPELSISGAKEGILLWHNNIVPTLFPFLILSNVMLRTNSIYYLNLFFTPLYRLFPTLNKNLPYLFLMGFFCGYPMGAKTADELIAQNLISKSLGKYVLLLCNHASPMFLIGYVLTASLQRQISLPLFFFLLYFPYFIYALILIFFPQKHSSSLSLCELVSPSVAEDDSIFFDSFYVIVKIGCYVMLFSILSQFLVFFFSEHSFFMTVFIGMTEITSGIHFILESTLPLKEKIALICGITSFGGLCSMAQTKSVLTKSRLSISFYCIGKFLLGCSSYFLAKLLL